jgi:hypothetical protein
MSLLAQKAALEGREPSQAISGPVSPVAPLSTTTAPIALPDPKP